MTLIKLGDKQVLNKMNAERVLYTLSINKFLKYIKNIEIAKSKYTKNERKM